MSSTKRTKSIKVYRVATAYFSDVIKDRSCDQSYNILAVDVLHAIKRIRPILPPNEYVESAELICRLDDGPEQVLRLREIKYPMKKIVSKKQGNDILESTTFGIPHLTVQAKTAMRDAGINKIKDLLNITRGDLLALNRFGHGSLDAIVDYLHDNDLKLAEISDRQKGEV